MANRRVMLISVYSIIFCVTARASEIIVDEEEGPILKVNGHEEYPHESVEEAVEHAPCHMKYQVMKRVVGTCIKLGKTARGCVAGNYLQPLHPECM